jgi:hypothetical protein
MQALVFSWIWYLKYQFDVNPDFAAAAHLVDSGERRLLTRSRVSRQTEEADGAPVVRQKIPHVSSLV